MQINHPHNTLRRLLLASVLLLSIGSGSTLWASAPSSSSQTNPTAAAATHLGSELRKTFNTLRDAGLELNEKQFLKVLQQAFQGKDTGIDPTEAEAQIRATLAPQRAANLSRTDTLNAGAEIAWVEQTAAALPDCVSLNGGTVLQTITPGNGASPSPRQSAVVAYTAKLSSGFEFDNTADEPEGTIALPLQHVVPGLADALMLMHVGGTYRVLIPPHRAYGSEAIMDLVPANAALDFTIELKNIK